jgi:hypothetical protein
VTGWPLSAVATELLLRRPVARQRFGLLTLKELVVSGVWVLGERQEARRLLGPRRVPVLRPGAVPVPARPPLPVLDSWLRRAVRGERDLAVLRDELAVAGPLVEQGLRDAEADLLRRGLLTRGTSRVLHRPVLRRTPVGEEWVTGLAARRAAWTRALRQGGPAAAAALAELSDAPGLVPLVDPRTAAALDRAWRDGGDAGGDASGVAWGDLGSLSSLDASFDAGGFDSGGDSGSDGGGDGGGGGD